MVTPRFLNMTPFMERVTQMLDGIPDLDRPEVRSSVTKPVAVGVDDQISLRLLAEQLVSEANAVLVDRAQHIDLADQMATGQLGFCMRYGPRDVVVRTSFEGDVALSELLGVGAGDDQVELAGPGELESLILLLLAPEQL